MNYSPTAGKTEHYIFPLMDLSAWADSIFSSARPQPDGSWIVKNMKPPVNSFADDFGIAFENSEERGIFSSTRKGKGDDDLYSFELPPLKFNVTGLVKDEKSGAVINRLTCTAYSQRR